MIERKSEPIIELYELGLPEVTSQLQKACGPVSTYHSMWWINENWIIDDALNHFCPCKILRKGKDCGVVSFLFQFRCVFVSDRFANVNRGGNKFYTDWQVLSCIFEVHFVKLELRLIPYRLSHIIIIYSHCLTFIQSQ